MHKIRTLLTIATLLILVGCGFKLRGTSPLMDAHYSYAVVDESRGGSSDYKEALITTLERQKSTITSPDNAQLILIIHAEHYTKMDLAASARGEERESTYYYTATITVRDDEGQTLIDRMSIERRRNYASLEENVLQNERAAEEIRRELTQEAVQQLMRSLNTLLRNR